MKTAISTILVGLAFALATGALLAWAGPSSPVLEPAADSRSVAVDEVIRAEMQKRRIPRPLPGHHPGRQDRQGDGLWRDGEGWRCAGDDLHALPGRFDQ